jgi:carbon-monoxide dehydrogenase medium subunit
LKWIDYVSPGSVKEAVDVLAREGNNARPLAGGTDILIQHRTGRREPGVLVDIKNIPELDELTYDASAGLTLGAAVPCHRIYEDSTIASVYPALVDATSIIGGIQIQGRASVGGNLCNSAPSADAVPALIALGVTCKIAGPSGTRTVPVEDFCTGPSQNVLQRGEILVSLHFPPPAPNSGARYIRFIPRNEMDIAVAGVGVSVVLENDKQTINSARVSLASVAPTPLFVREAGEALTGKPATDENIERAAQLARDAAKPITDMRGTIEYRKHLCAVLTRRALNTAIERARGNGS